MRPVNICSGLMKCGVFPYNPDATDCSISTDNPAGELGNNGRSNGNKENDMGDDRGESSSNEQGYQQLHDQDGRTFSDDQIRLFTLRYEEGYDVYDKEYLQWLTINHPESIPVFQKPEISFTDLSVLFHHVIHSPCLTIPHLISQHLILLPPAHQPVLHTHLKIICQLSPLALCCSLTLLAQTLLLTFRTQVTHHTSLIPIRPLTLPAPTPPLTLQWPTPPLTLKWPTTPLFTLPALVCPLALLAQHAAVSHFPLLDLEMNWGISLSTWFNTLLPHQKKQVFWLNKTCIRW